MVHIANESVLLLVDIQQRLMPSIFEGDRVVKEAVRLARIAQILDVPIIGTEQSPEGLGENVVDIKMLCDQTLTKHHFDGCEDGLVEALPGQRRHVIVAGCEAHVCVLQTCMGLLKRHAEVTVVVDAIGSRTERNYKAALHRLAEAGATFATVEMIAFEWMETSKHPRFRDVLALVR
ncbi:isochorismatase family protein [Cupriavidus consociatus]|uniref:isochorismatase family protein n=1 Tax=Cupriavidus consociatus TaxID=2821357 RepID=UPI001AEA4AD5|nr:MULTISPECIES: isochorismatase family protein [unclassified Cupriavidus]MBP0620936.1 isochorismatase family protein [Cupriavidus sp. LEh25]MDK2657603.1 isochorismatase family protein [Cupriavidus sp. LEh21]